MKVQYVPTADNVADIMTKVLEKATYLKHKSRLVVKPKAAFITHKSRLVLKGD